MSGGNLYGRVAIVTGAGGGLGAESARVMAAHGAALAIVDIDLGAAHRVAAEIEVSGGQALAVPLVPSIRNRSSTAPGSAACE